MMPFEHNVDYKYTWCEFLTPCPHGRDCFVGDFDCSVCAFFVKVNPINATQNSETKIDYSRYSKIYKGQILCKFKK